jgi:lysophospholipase L1-like esterase
MCQIALLLLAQTFWASPESKNPVAVILGSSTAAGVGASQIAASWAAGLEQRLLKRGIGVVNQSIPGASTADSLARFDRDVLPREPAFVFLATSIVNEGMLADPAGALARYTANTAALIERVRQAGAIPILMTMYPHNAYSPAHVEALGRWMEYAESTGWPVLNFMSTVSDPERKWLRGLTADGVHPVDAGHRQMLEAIPDSLLVSLLGEQPAPATEAPRGSWRAPGDSEGEHALRVQLDRPASSWTIAAFIRDPALTEDVDYFAADGEQPVRLARRLNRLELWAGAERIWTRSAPAYGWRHFLLSYQALTGRLVVSIDGAQWGEAAGPVDATFDAARVAGRCRGCNVAQLLVYRANLHPQEFAALGRCSTHRRSLDYKSALNAGEAINEAQTLTSLEFEGAWAVDNDRFPPACEQEEGGSRK